MARSELVDVTVEKHHETDRAWLVSDDGENKVWVPKSECELEKTPDGKAYVLTLPEWLAVEKGFV